MSACGWRYSAQKEGLFNSSSIFSDFLITCIFHHLLFSDFSFSGTCVFLCKCVVCVLSSVGCFIYLFDLYFLAMAFLSFAANIFVCFCFVLLSIYFCVYRLLHQFQLRIEATFFIPALLDARGFA